MLGRIVDKLGDVVEVGKKHLRALSKPPEPRECEFPPEAAQLEAKRVAEGVKDSVGDVIFDERVRIGPYRIEAPDELSLARWKKQIGIIEDFLRKGDLESLQTYSNKNGNQRLDFKEIKTLLNSRLTEEDFKLLAIGIFLTVEKSSWDAVRSKTKEWAGGQFQMRDFFTKDGGANCIDLSHTAKFLAEKYGIKGTVKREPGHFANHRYFETDSGKVLDVFYAYKRAGFFESVSEYEKYLAD